MHLLNVTFFSQHHVQPGVIWLVIIRFIRFIVCSAELYKLTCCLLVALSKMICNFFSINNSIFYSYVFKNFLSCCYICSKRETETNYMNCSTQDRETRGPFSASEEMDDSKSHPVQTPGNKSKQKRCVIGIKK